jgi:hypothetical protein
VEVYKIVLEEHFLPCELDEYFHTPVKKAFPANLSTRFTASRLFDTPRSG